MTADTLVPCMASVVYTASFGTRPSHYDGRYDSSPVLKAAARTCYRHLTVQRLACCASDMPVSPFDPFVAASVSLDMQSKAALVAPGMAGCAAGYASGLHMFTRACAPASQLAYLVQGTMLHAVVHRTVHWALAGVD